MQNIKKKLRKKLYKIVRNLVVKEYAGYLGKIEEHDDKIICYVNNKKLIKKRDSLYYEIFFTHYLDKDILSSYKLNKPVYYIIENMNFDRILKFSSCPNTYIKFKKCKFHKAIYMNIVDNVSFENNTYFNRFCGSLFDKCFLSGKVQNLEFINENFINCEKTKMFKRFGIDVEVNNLKIVDSQINTNEKSGEIILKVKEDLIIEDSEINSPIIEIDSKNIEISNSELHASIGVIINNENNNEIENVYSKEIIYNGLNINEEKITKEDIELKMARQRLINKLAEIRNSCNSINNSIINNVERNLNEQNVSKTLKM